MKGLLTKDLIILKLQLKSLLMIGICGVVMGMTFESTATIGYLAIIGTMIAIGTMGYDEFDNGYAFLFTLPIGRRTYVREKYLLALGSASVMILIGSIITFVMMTQKGLPDIPKEIALTACSMLGVAMLFISFLIPIRVKYNSEKSRTVTYILYAAILVLVFAGSRLLKLLGVSTPAFIAELDQMNPYIILAALAGVIILILCVSEQISERIIIRKEY